ncbi:MarR family winged helix-turn-helix transcriptional regulator [Pediococcus siamensis]|uniref:MarR family winged helix-turn-helix transcriptional regulator n=1 Tax=Pediococcus siamensis TaxID=381829 RepID=UPI0039A0FA75
MARKPGQIALQRDIEQEFMIRRSSATTLLQRMEQNDLITRTVAATDARQKQIQLTTKSQKWVEIVDGYLRDQKKRLDANFSSEQLQTFETILRFLRRDEAGKNYGKESEA